MQSSKHTSQQHTPSFHVLTSQKALFRIDGHIQNQSCIYFEEKEMLPNKFAFLGVRVLRVKREVARGSLWVGTGVQPAGFQLAKHVGKKERKQI